MKCSFLDDFDVAVEKIDIEAKYLTMTKYPTCIAAWFDVLTAAISAADDNQLYWLLRVFNDAVEHNKILDQVPMLKYDIAYIKHVQQMIAKHEVNMFALSKYGEVFSEFESEAKRLKKAIDNAKKNYQHVPYCVWRLLNVFLIANDPSNAKLTLEERVELLQREMAKALEAEPDMVSACKDNIFEKVKDIREDYV